MSRAESMVDLISSEVGVVVGSEWIVIVVVGMDLSWMVYGGQFWEDKDSI